MILVFKLIDIVDGKMKVHADYPEVPIPATFNQIDQSQKRLETGRKHKKVNQISEKVFMLITYFLFIKLKNFLLDNTYRSD